MISKKNDTFLGKWANPHLPIRIPPCLQLDGPLEVGLGMEPRHAVLGHLDASRESRGTEKRKAKDILVPRFPASLLAFSLALSSPHFGCVFPSIPPPPYHAAPIRQGEVRPWEHPGRRLGGMAAPQDQPQTPPAELHKEPTLSMVLGGRCGPSAGLGWLIKQSLLKVGLMHRLGRFIRIPRQRGGIPRPQAHLLPPTPPRRRVSAFESCSKWSMRQVTHASTYMPPSTWHR